MGDVTQILSAIDAGDPRASEKLLPLVYDELRQLVAQKMTQERAGQTLDATALVHEAYLRLVGGTERQQWNSRGHFFAAAAEAMRRILVEGARRRRSLKRGGGLVRNDLARAGASTSPAAEILAVHEALDKLAALDARAAELVKLRYFAGFTIAEAAEMLGISSRTADNAWAYARAWLKVELGPGD